ncbi:MAG: hypothetical protein JO036_15730 [Candidatus Eremiobacteraeota bacterium]|nr:hypothetical protein [Candidatus Eremiobacteraeota bacterium]
MALASYQAVQNFINQVLQANKEDGGVTQAPHKSFWSTLTYQQFTQGNVPGVTDDKNKPVRILVPGNSAGSALIQVLQGTGIADPKNGAFDQMPANGPPFFTDAQIKEIADWIDAGCPQ